MNRRLITLLTIISLLNISDQASSTCSSTADCLLVSPDTFCDAGKCVPLKTENQKCLDSAQCQSGYCDPATTRCRIVNRGYNSTCRDTQDCAPSLFCLPTSFDPSQNSSIKILFGSRSAGNSGKCIWRFRFGEKCASNDFCTFGLACVNGTCAPDASFANLQFNAWIVFAIVFSMGIFALVLLPIGICAFFGHGWFGRFRGGSVDKSLATNPPSMASLDPSYN